MMYHFSFSLGKEQLQKLKDAAKQGNYLKFDVTLLYLLIRNLSLPSLPLPRVNVTTPSNGWGKLPSSPSHVTMGDDIERVRDFRNRVYGHADSTSIQDPVFQGYWNTVQDICTRMDGRYGGTVFTDKLKDIEKIDSVPKVIMDVVKEQIQRDAELKKELEGMKGNLNSKCINSSESKRYRPHNFCLYIGLTRS